MEEDGKMFTKPIGLQNLLQANRESGITIALLRLENHSIAT